MGGPVPCCDHNRRWDAVVGSVIDAVQAHPQVRRVLCCSRAGQGLTAPWWSATSYLRALELLASQASKIVDFSRISLFGYSTGGWLGAAACKGARRSVGLCGAALIALDTNYPPPHPHPTPPHDKRRLG